MNKTKFISKNLSILFILLIGGIGVQTLTSCSSDNDDKDGGDSSSSVLSPSSSSGGTDPSSSSSANGGSSSSANGSSSSGGGLCEDIPIINCGTTPCPQPFCDERDGNIYMSVRIGSQTWMAENLNYNAEGNKCYDDNPANCVTYGRLYDWATAMGFASSCNSSICSGQILSKHRGICPEGWHIPTNADWNQLYRYVDGTSGTSSPYDSPTAGKHLKATTGWTSCSPSGSSHVCLDTHGFSALPGGDGYSNGNFVYVGSRGYWWSASELYGNDAYGRHMYYNYEYASWNSSDKTDLYSVRCLRD